MGLGVKIYNLVPLPVTSLVPKPPLCEQAASCCGLHSSGRLCLLPFLCALIACLVETGERVLPRDKGTVSAGWWQTCYHEQIPQPWQLVTVATVN